MSCTFQLVVFTSVNICFIDDNCKEKCIKAIWIKETSKILPKHYCPLMRSWPFVQTLVLDMWFCWFHIRLLLVLNVLSYQQLLSWIWFLKQIPTWLVTKHWIWIEKSIMSPKNHVLKLPINIHEQDEWVGGL
jgi:hypothetical protein